MTIRGGTSPTRRVAQAIDALRHGWAIALDGRVLLPAETAMGAAGSSHLLISAARMLALLGIGAVRLMTNNPEKVAALAGCGVSITERVPHALPANPHNHRYLETKRDRAGHLL